VGEKVCTQAAPGGGGCVWADRELSTRLGMCQQSVVERFYGVVVCVCVWGGGGCRQASPAGLSLLSSRVWA
jgi:hypothetical protein